MAREDFAPAPDTGGGGEYEITITEAYFAPSEAYTAKSGRPNLFLHWLGSTNREAQPIMTRDSYHPSFNCGVYNKEDWETLDGGRTAHHPNPPKTGAFGSQSRAQELLTRVAGIPPKYEGALIPPGTLNPDPFDEKKGTDASVWVGLKFKMATVKTTKNVPNESGQGRVNREFEYEMPVEFLGRVDVNAPAAAAAETPAATGGNGGVHPNVLRARLKALAVKSETHDAFTAAAMQIDGVGEHADLLEEVFDEGPGGLFAQAHS